MTADARRVVFALAAVWVLGSAVTKRAVGYGDGGEYHLTAEIAWTAALACAVLSQILVVFGRGGLTQAEDGERHSYAARLALRHAPAVYNPTPDIFVSRTLGRWAKPDEPAVYRDGTGCRKAWVRPRDVDLLEQVCGRLPPDRSFFDKEGRDRRQSWGYVDYGHGSFDTPGRER